MSLFSKKTKKISMQPPKLQWRLWLENIVIPLLLILAVRNNPIFGWYQVPSGSAEPNLLVGDRIWGNRLAYRYDTIKRGDLAIFDDPYFTFAPAETFKYYWQRYVGLPLAIFGLGAGADSWVKRVIAIPGDTIEGRVEEGKTVVYLNGKKLEETYVNRLPLIYAEKKAGLVPFSHLGPIPVPDFLQYKSRFSKYVFDPAFALDQQPYYKLKPEEVVKSPLTGGPLFDRAFTPTLRDEYGSTIDAFGPFTMPPGKYWVMGDNRKNSGDSRMWLFLDEKNICGRAALIMYSLDSQEAFWFIDLFKHPIDFWTKIVRWSRCGKLLPKVDVE
ncbi:signal peptidase I [Candidatus Dependentiae bacterium]|nr:signal peptidase I [Candidatus Dependentiae bacterium]